MRTIKASEVRKGMRVEYVRDECGVETIVRGLAARDAESSHLTTVLYLGSAAAHYIVKPETEVTVLAEPEPEWVEGAWYWVELTSEPSRPLKRLAGGWTCYDDDRAWFSDDSYPDITVLGRVLIVDWTGDDVAAYLAEQGDNLMSVGNIALCNAIRTQGGAR